MCLLQKIALDKLSVKVHKMYGKVKEASMLSVRPEVIDPKKGQQPSLIQQLERKCSCHVMMQSLGVGELHGVFEMLFDGVLFLVPRMYGHVVKLRRARLTHW